MALQYHTYFVGNIDFQVHFNSEIMNLVGDLR